MTAVDLAGRADRNLLEAQQSLAGRTVIVYGVVRQTTLRSRERIEVTGRGPYAPATAVTVADQVPLVILQPGSVFCYFEPEHIADAVQLKEGDSVTFECEVRRFDQGQQMMTVSTLAGCRRAAK